MYETFQYVQISMLRVHNKTQNCNFMMSHTSRIYVVQDAI